MEKPCPKLNEANQKSSHPWKGKEAWENNDDDKDNDNSDGDDDIDCPSFPD